MVLFRTLIFGLGCLLPLRAAENGMTDALYRYAATVESLAQQFDSARKALQGNETVPVYAHMWSKAISTSQATGKNWAQARSSLLDDFNAAAQTGAITIPEGSYFYVSNLATDFTTEGRRRRGILNHMVWKITKVTDKDGNEHPVQGPLTIVASLSEQGSDRLSARGTSLTFVTKSGSSNSVSLQASLHALDGDEGVVFPSYQKGRLVRHRVQEGELSGFFILQKTISLLRFKEDG